MNILIEPGNWLRALAGGGLIGLSAALLLLFTGRIAGVSGIIGGLALDRRPGDLGWRACFLLGLVLGGDLFLLIDRQALPTPTVGWPGMLVGGLLVGFGTRMGQGCTSGHGVCGIARLSTRSLTATATFLIFGFLTVFALRHLGRHA